MTQLFTADVITEALANRRYQSRAWHTGGASEFRRRQRLDGDAELPTSALLV